MTLDVSRPERIERIVIRQVISGKKLNNSFSEYIGKTGEKWDNNLRDFLCPR
jgi:hypothetical protein